MAHGSSINDFYYFDFKKPLGKGKYGTTFNGNSKDGTKVAVKQITYKPKPDTTCDPNSICESFKNLITRDDLRRNKYLLPYLDYDMNKEGTFWIILKYCDQGNLAEYYQDNTKLTLSDQIDLMTQCADGITHLHSCQIIHRQIKPQNILLSRQGEQDIIQIADFYSATMFERDNLSSLQLRSKSESNREWIEEDYFKPPEALKKIGNTDKITKYYDTFSLGLVYYAMVRTLNGSRELKPVVEGNRLPIGHLISEKKGKHWKFVLFNEDEVVDKIGPLKQVIDNMIVLNPPDRLSSCDVLNQLKGLQQGEPEKTTTEPKARDISSYLHKKFHQFLLESGPCEPTCDKILDKVYELQKAEFKTIMAKGSIKDFLLEFDDIISKDDKLQAVENNTEKETMWDCNEEEYNQFKKKIESDEEINGLILDTYASLDGATIYVSTEKENIQKVTDHLKEHFSEFTCKCFSPNDDDFVWLMTNEETFVYVDKCIGPGSFMAADKQLVFLKKNCGNKTPYDLRMFTLDLEDWGSIGCFARNRSDHSKIYALSVKHIVGQQFGYHSDHDLDMVSAFQQENEVTVERGVVREELQVKTKDFVHLTKGYHGILDGINENNVIVDVALFGPLSSAMKRNHKSFSEESGKKIQVIKNNDSDIVGKVVMKYGATTGFTSGIIIEANKESTLKFDGIEKEFTGAFVVTSTGQDGKPEQNGRFAKPGDSGSIVFLKDNSGSLKGLGLVHRRKNLFTYQLPTSLNKERKIENVIFCVRLNYCVDALEQELSIPLDLYFHNFTPNLCLGGQEDEQEFTDTPDTSIQVRQVTSGCEFCHGKKQCG